MKNGRLKKHLLALLVICVLSFMLTACGGKKDPDNSQGGNNPGATDGNGAGSAVMLSRADYIGLVGKTFGYDNFEATTDFFPDVPSSNKYYKNVVNL